jgi:hypothetical protein
LFKARWPRAAHLKTLGKEMKTPHILWLFVWLNAVVACSAQVERRVDLGDGYDAAMIAKPSKASFESISHWEYLRYKEKELWLLGHYDLSPDKRFVAFQESDTGKLFLLDKKEQSRVELVAEFPGLVRIFDWKSKAGFLKIEIYEKEALMIQLPVAPKTEPRVSGH